MRDCVVACAMKKESKILRERLGTRCTHLVTGLGMNRTRAALESYLGTRSPSILVFTGTAGQLDPGLKMGDVVFPERWCLQTGGCFESDPALVAFLRERGVRVSGAGVTVRIPVIKKQDRERLHRSRGASICDMESAAVLEVARSHGVPAVAPKVVSDTAETGILGFRREFEANVARLSQYLDGLLRIVAEFNPDAG
ncbi:MAG: hypothetical protein OXH11_02320 [Candidatus Aminicenantes bacterium]|nr:hypothetical protein [Candidatus Aminicenantes bacterium]